MSSLAAMPTGGHPTQIGKGRIRVLRNGKDPVVSTFGRALTTYSISSRPTNPPRCGDRRANAQAVPGFPKMPVFAMPVRLFGDRERVCSERAKERGAKASVYVFFAENRFFFAENGLTVWAWFRGPWPDPRPGAVRIASRT